VCALVASLPAACGHGYRSFPQLAKDAAAIPVPPQVQFVREQRSVHAPGFFTGKFEEVDRQFKTSLSCPALEAAWRGSLTRRHRSFHVLRFSENGGTLRIELTDRPEHVGISLGNDQHCGTPFVWAFNYPH
jgi:hypothetical protein